MSEPTQDVTEFFDSAEEVKAKACLVADLIRASKHATLFTGAGLSTSAGIPDFRGPNGVWTLKAQGRSAKGADLMRCNPTIAHMVCKKLLDTQHVKHICSQNVDGLHRRSGVPRELLSELHGNTNLEICDKCGRDYFRDFETRRNGNGVFEHKTGRKCEAEDCDGDLCDSIINFGESLPKKEWAKAEREFAQTNVCVVLGSSCKVTPAANLPESVGQRGKQGGWPKLVIVNLQRTPLDHLAHIKIHARTDEFLSLLARELGLSGQMPQLPPESEILATVEAEAARRNSHHPFSNTAPPEAATKSVQDLNISSSAKHMLRGA